MNATTYGLDLAKAVFQVYWVDGQGRAHNRRIKRAQLSEFFARTERGRVVMEACASAHHWARVLGGLGHEVRLIAAQHVRAFVLTNKSDAADARAIWTAAQQPHMRFVPIKTLEQQAVLTLVGERQLLVDHRSAMVNRLRGVLGEYGVVLVRGRVAGLAQVRERAAEIERSVPAAVQRRLHEALAHLQRQDEQIAAVEAEMKALLHGDARYRRLMTIPGVGPLTAAVLWARLGDGRQFASGRQAAAWVGVVPRHSGTGGRTVLGGISKRGDATLRTLLIHGARSVIAHTKTPSPWLAKLKARRPPNVVAVALANKTMRIAWRVLVSNETYDSAHEPRARRAAHSDEPQAA